jgi:integrase
MKSKTSLTAAQVRSAKEMGKYFDGLGTGLYLRIDRGGRKYWVQRVTINKKRCEIGLGNYPLVTLAMARDQALENKRRIHTGNDPLAEKRKSKMDDRFSAVAEKYLEVKLAEFRNEKHKKQWRSTLERFAFPLLGAKSVNDITVHDILAVLRPIWETKTETASRLRGQIEKILSWAIVSELRDGDNPARWRGNLSEVLAAPSKIKKVRNHPAIAQNDTVRWWADLSARKGMSIAALQFTALSAARSGEIRGMVWNEIDFEAGHWTIPKERMKTQRQHRVPLTENMRTILENLPRLHESPYVFFSPKGGMLSDMALSKVMRGMTASDLKRGGKGYLDTKSGDPAVPHGLRSTFRDWAAEHGEDHHMAEIALAHSVGSVVYRAYRRTDAQERRRKMMQRWERFLIGK